MCCGSEAGSYLRRIDSCITQLKAEGPSRTCNESKEEAGHAGVEAVHGALRLEEPDGSGVRLLRLLPARFPIRGPNAQPEAYPGGGSCRHAVASRY